MTRKKALSPGLLAECEAAHALFLAKKNELNLSQKKVADEAGISAPAVNLYFKGTNALNLQFAMVLSRLLQEPIEKFSKRLSIERAHIARSDMLDAAMDQVERELDLHPLDGPALMAREAAKKARNLTLLASPRSQSALAKIAEAADSGRLTEDDVLLLEKIATHLEAKKQIQPSFVEVPPELKALAEATINMAQSGENPDDLLKMLEHGLKKRQPTEDIKKNDVSKKKPHRA